MPDQSVSFNEFIEGVTERDENLMANNDDALPTAAFHARVVVDVLSDAVSEGELNDLRYHLSDEYDQLFELAEANQHPGQE